MKNKNKVGQRSKLANEKLLAAADSLNARRKFFLFRNIPLVFMLVPIPIAWIFIYLKFFYFEECTAAKFAPSANTESAHELRQYRDSDFKYTSPLLMSEELDEAAKLQQLKQQINNTVTSFVASHNVQSVSVYVSNLNNAQWFCINPEDQFIPASLMKVPLMMAYLKDSETTPGLLDRKLLFEKPKIEMPVQTYTTDPTVVGNYYTIRELISNMIVYSDNNAAYLLQMNANESSYMKIFTSLGLPGTPFINANFRMRIKDYTKLFHLLYNGSYLSEENSEYALKLLTKAVFNKGITRNIPVDITVAHKFGETKELPNSGIANQLNETAIIYFDNNPVLLAVFTKGRDKENMSNVLNSVSQIVFNYFVSHKQ